MACKMYEYSLHDNSVFSPRIRITLNGLTAEHKEHAKFIINKNETVQ